VLSDGLSEAIEAAWRDKQELVFADVDRAVREAIDEALQASQQARARRIDAVSREVAELTARRDALRAEVEDLRAEADVLRPQLAAARQTIEDLERRRRVAEEAQRALTREAETRRRRMLGELEELAGQITQMRANLLGLLGGEAALPAERSGGGLDAPEPGSRPDLVAEPVNPTRPPAPTRLERPARPADLATNGIASALDLRKAVGESDPLGARAIAPERSEEVAEPSADPPDPAAEPAIDAAEPAGGPDLPTAASSDTPALDYFAGTAVAHPAASEAEGELPVFELLPADGSAGAATPEPAPAEPQQVTVKITNLANLAEGMQLRKTMRSLPGIVSLSFPQFREGTMTMTVRHERGPAFVADVVALPSARLSLVKDAGETVEFCVGK
jgi:hypothetical protein